MLKKLYRAHGELCAHHPWEVIVIMVTMTTCLVTMDGSREPLNKEPLYACQGQACHLYKLIDAIVMTAIRCIAVLYSYYQLRNLYRLGSKYLLVIAGLFTVFSSFIFCSSVIKCLGGDASDLKDALFFLLLLVDVSKAALLVRLAVGPGEETSPEDKIARGLQLIGPSLTLDTVVETLVISIGTLSGIRRLEVLSYYACLSVLINFVVLMTFYPACLRLVIDLSTPGWRDALASLRCPVDKRNPVAERVKVVMSAGLVVVHAASRWSTTSGGSSLHNSNTLLSPPELHLLPDDPAFVDYLTRLIDLSAEHILLLIIVLSLTVKFLFFEKPIPFESEVKESDVNFKRESGPKKCEDCLKKLDEDDAEETVRPLEECLKMYKENKTLEGLNDGEVVSLVKGKHFASYQLERVLGAERGVGIRRKSLGFKNALRSVPWRGYDYSKVVGVCCENIVGYIPVPLGVAGPLLIDGKHFHIPMATTEGCLVASTNRGCRALVNGVSSRVEDVGMTRGPVLRFPSLEIASKAECFLKGKEGFSLIKEDFDATSRFARLLRLETRLCGRLLYVRFVSLTGDAMGMNMVSKGTEASLTTLIKHFPDTQVISISGNYCSDKKAAAINWIQGRGKSVVCESVVPGNIVRSVLKTTVSAMVDVNTTKNLVGSAAAGTLGGSNAHAANIVTAIYMATGQDVAQNVSSSACLTLMEELGEDLYISVTMPSLEVGTIGGGTALGAQSGCLSLLGVAGPAASPGANACTLARAICATVLAGELSLMAALSAGHLVQSHMKHNRCQPQ